MTKERKSRASGKPCLENRALSSQLIAQGLKKKDHSPTKVPLGNRTKSLTGLNYSIPSVPDTQRGPGPASQITGTWAIPFL